MASLPSLGIIGGTGMLGSAIARGLLRSGALGPDGLWVSSRSGGAAGLDADGPVRATDDSQALADACEIVLLSVPPAAAAGLRVDARDRLIVSVMAGVTVDRLREITSAERIVRAMSSPAAEHRLAYSPWLATPGVSTEDRERIAALFGAVGLTDEVPDEGQLDLFTAMTGPVPGFVAFYADCMVRFAVDRGVEPATAERAVRQLFRAAGFVLTDDPLSPAEHVRQMIDYAGTTAAGLEAMQAGQLADAIAHGLDAAVERARSIGGEGPRSG